MYKVKYNSFQPGDPRSEGQIVVSYDELTKCRLFKVVVKVYEHDEDDTYAEHVLMDGVEPLEGETDHLHFDTQFVDDLSLILMQQKIASDVATEPCYAGTTGIDSIQIIDAWVLKYTATKDGRNYYQYIAIFNTNGDLISNSNRGDYISLSGSYKELSDTHYDFSDMTIGSYSFDFAPF